MNTAHMAEDYYKTLGVVREASQAEIDKAYRDLARKYHPDLNPKDKDAKRKFQEVQTAYDVLKDSEKREMYDRYGHSFESMGAGGPAGGGPQWSTTGGAGFEGFDFSDLFRNRQGAGGFEGGEGFADFFRQASGGPGGGRTSRRQPRHTRGADILHELKVPFATSVVGGEAQLKIQRANGKLETISVKIPPGVEDGQKIRLRGQGEAPPTGQGEHGDILIIIRVAPHANFTRRGNNLEVVVPITVAEAVQGVKVDLPTPRGVITLTVPPGTSSGKKLRIKGHGVVAKNKPQGDLLAEVQIVLPRQISDEAREALLKLGDSDGAALRQELRW